MEDSVTFLKKILAEIKRQDPLHAKTLKTSMPCGGDFDALMNVLYAYFKGHKTSAKTVANDYLRMVGDMRREAVYFDINGDYRCKSQQEAYEKVYSNPAVMRYYINGLIISQVLWVHHFKMLMYFRETIRSFKIGYLDVLDIGAGHGLYSYYTREVIPVNSIDILDLSSESLAITKSIIGNHTIHYIESDIQNYYPEVKYDLVILGEVLEHLDDPMATLLRIYDLLDEGGILWVTVPTNAPAIDHTYLFKDKDEVVKLLGDAGFTVMAHFDCQADYMTSIIGAFCCKK
jgi:SAM-dependent methyltransferase